MDKITRPEVKVLPPSSKECKKKKKTLVCVATGFYPDHVKVSWEIGGEVITKGVGTDNVALWNEKTEKYSITSRLRVSAKLWYNTKNAFTCIVHFYDGKKEIEYTGHINGMPDPSGGMTSESYVKSTQTAKLSYGIFIAKSSLFGLFIIVLVWKKLQGSPEKQV